MALKILFLAFTIIEFKTFKCEDDVIQDTSLRMDIVNILQDNSGLFCGNAMVCHGNRTQITLQRNRQRQTSCCAGESSRSFVFNVVHVVVNFRCFPYTSIFVSVKDTHLFLTE